MEDLVKDYLIEKLSISVHNIEHVEENPSRHEYGNFIGTSFEVTYITSDTSYAKVNDVNLIDLLSFMYSKIK